VDPILKPRMHMLFNLGIAIVPFVALIVAIVLLWQSLVTPVDLAIFAGMYVVTTFGISIGYHRLLSHRSFETYPAIRNTLAALGSMVGEGPPIIWVADHRKHHAFADEEGDPHSPHLENGPPTLRRALKGIWHAHMGWLFDLRLRSEPLRYAPDLVRDPAMRTISSLFLVLAAAGFAIPFLLGLVITQTLHGALTALLWGGPVRLFFSYHTTFSVNSIGHFFGRRRFQTSDQSRNVFWLALPSLGDSWHHNHHAFPRSARHGLRWWELDPSAWVIALMRRVGLAWNVVEISEERMQAKLLGRPQHPTASS
jgi:stearoyl-CoA desaturase (Delta-9 desaturase)